MQAQLLGPDECFDLASADGTNTLLLIQKELVIDDCLPDSASILRIDAMSHGGEPEGAVNNDSAFWLGAEKTG
jgi:hypothetical protein